MTVPGGPVSRSFATKLRGPCAARQWEYRTQLDVFLAPEKRLPLGISQEYTKHTTIAAET